MQDKSQDWAASRTQGCGKILVDCTVPIYKPAAILFYSFIVKELLYTHAHCKMDELHEDMRIWLCVLNMAPDDDNRVTSL